MTDEPTDGEQSRRKFMKTSAAVGLTATGTTALAGGAAAQGADLTNRNVPVTPRRNPETGAVVTKALLTINSVDTSTGTITSGTLQYTVNQLGQTTTTTQSLAGVPIDVLPGNNNGRCDILRLEIGPIFLTLLGLDVFIGGGSRENPQPIVVDVDAVQDGVLGNLLCSLAGQ